MARKHLCEKLEDRLLLSVNSVADNESPDVSSWESASLGPLQVSRGAWESEQFPSSEEFLPDSLTRQTFADFEEHKLPEGWDRWSNGSATIGVAANDDLNTVGLLSNGTSNGVARTWSTVELSPEALVSARVYLNSLIPTEVFLSGSDLDTSTPSYYSVAVTRGLEVKILQNIGGNTHVLASLNSNSYVSGKWVKVTLVSDGKQLSAQVMDEETGQYLNKQGGWQGNSDFAVQVEAPSQVEPGFGGVQRSSSYAGEVWIDDVETRSQVVMKPQESLSETFDEIKEIPGGWQKFSRGTGSSWSLSSDQSISGQQSATVSGVSDFSSRLWPEAIQLEDAEVTASIYLNSLIPASVFVRGTELNTKAPSYYAATLTRGLEVELTRVDSGESKTLAKVASNEYFSSQWAKVILRANGDNLRVQVYNPKTGRFLNQKGEWQRENVWAINIRDATISGSGHAGLERGARYAGSSYFDDFSINTADGDSLAPEVAISLPTVEETASGIIAVEANATDATGVTKVEFYVDGVRRSVDLSAPYSWQFDTTSAANGKHQIEVRAYDLAGNVGSRELEVVTQNESSIFRPEIPQHLSHIRIAALAYSGWSIGDLETRLLEDYIDLVVPNPQYLDAIDKIAPDTPNLVYTNTTNIYLGLLESWLSYAVTEGVDPESAFYHAARATNFEGHSASAVPVNQFWLVRNAGVDVTKEVLYSQQTTLGGVGSNLFVGHLDRFRELNFELASGAGNGWSGEFEYPVAVDSEGEPTEWAKLTLLDDATESLTQSGRITFDPPANWVPTKSVKGSFLYHIRLSTTSSGQAPVVVTLKGRDYVQARGEERGVIPVFDSSVDLNQDGYLNDAEFAQRSDGKDARFVHESRLFSPYYGQMRFATNPASIPYREWTIDYHEISASANSKVDGFFMDNSGGRAPFKAEIVLEPIEAYSQEYATLINGMSSRMQPHWILANTAGGGLEADQVVQRNPAYLDEFAIRALAHDFGNFKDQSNTVQRRMSLTSPAPFAVIDSHPTGGSATDPRTQIATLAYYYMLSDPESTFLMFYGGFDPAGQWSQHWSEAVTYDVGNPTAKWSVFAKGADPANAELEYHVIQRKFENALVLYKPLSSQGNVKGSLGGGSATTHELGASYRPLLADGTLGEATDAVSLRNGEGAILVPVVDLEATQLQNLLGAENTEQIVINELLLQTSDSEADELSSLAAVTVEQYELVEGTLHNGNSSNSAQNDILRATDRDMAFEAIEASQDYDADSLAKEYLLSFSCELECE